MSVRAILLVATIFVGGGSVRAETPVETRIVRPPPPASAEIPEVLFDLARLPAPVRRMRERILNAAKTGDLEALRPIIQANAPPPDLLIGAVETTDPIEILRRSLDDETGYEILAILIDILEAGFVRVEAGGPEEMYVWPYFAQYPLAALTPPQKVQLLRIVTAYDYKQMEPYGAYAFYRLGIAPDGRWRFFLTGH